jgi:predicted DNA binding CopG/RHH family protein
MSRSSSTSQAEKKQKGIQMKTLHLNHEEKELLEEIERDEWHSVIQGPSDLTQFRDAARRTLKKDKRVNIRISERELNSIQRIAIEEGIPYQTLVASILHKYVEGRLHEDR